MAKTNSTATKEKVLTVKELQRAGFPVVPGNEYIPARMVPQERIPISEVRRRLAKIKGTLAEEIARIREEK